MRKRMRALSFEERVIVLGITYSGKSYFTKTALVGSASRFVVFDLRREYPRDIPNVRGMSLADFARFAVENPRAMRDKNEPLRVAIHPDNRSAEDSAYQASEFRDFVRICESALCDALIVIEECGQFEDNGKAQASINYLATQSRHWGCPLVLVAQCAVQIPKISRRQAHRVYSFRQVDREDLRALGQYFGALSENLPRLPQGEYYGYDAAEYDVREPANLLPARE